MRRRRIGNDLSAIEQTFRCGEVRIVVAAIVVRVRVGGVVLASMESLAERRSRIRHCRGGGCGVAGTFVSLFSVGAGGCSSLTLHRIAAGLIDVTCWHLMFCWQFRVLLCVERDHDCDRRRLNTYGVRVDERGDVEGRCYRRCSTG